MYLVIESPKLSTEYEKRYIIIDKESGEILDDAQGYGYKTRQKAHAGYAYKTRDRTKDAEKLAKKKLVLDWCRKNKKFVRSLEEDAFRIAKGSMGQDDKFNAKWVKDAFKKKGFTELPFTAAEFLKYWEE